MKRWTWIPLIALPVLGAAGVASFQLWKSASVQPETLHPDALADPSIEPALSGSPAQRAAQRYDALRSEQEREAHIRWVAQQVWASWEAPVLRSAILSDPSASVQAAALEESLRMARREGGAAPTSVVRLGLASNKGNTRAAALKAAREHGDPNFVQELIELVDDRDAYAAMALNALAYTDAVEAHTKIREVAANEDGDRELRERAIALLGITKDREALSLLNDLVVGQDDALRRLATEVIKVINSK